MSQMYNDKVMEHFINPKNVGEIENADGTGQVGSAACGDIMKIDIKVENDVIVDVKFKTYGCGAAVASSSIATEMILGKTIEEALKFTNQDLIKEIGGLPSEKIHCSVLAEEALQAAIKDYKEKISKLTKLGNLLIAIRLIKRRKLLKIRIHSF